MSFRLRLRTMINIRYKVWVRVITEWAHHNDQGIGLLRVPFSCIVYKRKSEVPKALPQLPYTASALRFLPFSFHPSVSRCSSPSSAADRVAFECETLERVVDSRAAKTTMKKKMRDEKRIRNISYGERERERERESSWLYLILPSSNFLFCRAATCIRSSFARASQAPSLSLGSSCSTTLFLFVPFKEQKASSNALLIIGTLKRRFHDNGRCYVLLY